MRFGKLVTIKKVKKLPDDKDKHDKCFASVIAVIPPLCVQIH